LDFSYVTGDRFGLALFVPATRLRAWDAIRLSEFFGSSRNYLSRFSRQSVMELTGQGFIALPTAPITTVNLA